jgi:hypothetical protein
MSELTDTIMLLVALASFGVLMIGWMILPTDVMTEETAERTAPAAVRTA